MRIAFLFLPLFLSATVSAQDSIPDAWPLEVGNRWVFQTDYWNLSPAPSGGVTSDRRTGSIAWEVTGEVAGGTEALPVLTIERTLLGAGTSTWTCAVRTREENDILYFDLVGPDGMGSCEADPPVVPSRFSGEGLANFGAGFEQPDVTIGGVTYAQTRALFVNDSDTIVDRLWGVAEGIGPIQFSYGASSGGFASANRAQLRYAEVGGATYGVPLDLGGDFVSFDPGNTWIYEARDARAGWLGFVTWTVVEEEGATRLRLDRTLFGQTTTLGTCDVTRDGPAPETGWALQVRFDGDCAGGELLALPLDLDSGERGFHVRAYTPDRPITVGGEDYTADTNRWFDTEGDFETERAVWEVARGIGVTSYAVRNTTQPEPNDWTLTLAFASVGGEAFGTMPVAREPVPDRLALRVSPNPTMDRVAVMGAGGPPVTLQVLDVRGRVVRQLEPTTLPASVDVRDLAPGVYAIVATEGETRLKTRFVVAR
ncbi:MAG: T9SS type A sorting domain-containing protein [Bacteroidota bacterium]